MFRGDFAGVGRAARSRQLQFDCRKACLERVADAFPKFRAGRNAGHKLSFLLRCLDGFFPFGLPSAFRLSRKKLAFSQEEAHR